MRLLGDVNKGDKFFVTTVDPVIRVQPGESFYLKIDSSRVGSAEYVKAVAIEVGTEHIRWEIV